MKCDEIYRKAICPFYQQTVRTAKGQFVGIQCEPILDDEKLGFRTTHITRISPGELNGYAEMFCEDQWQTCPYANALLKIKYKESV